MAITSCPYCHAIVDETTKYCNNCGTQLLFPEDDELEEEIPGEKIIDVEVDEEKNYDTGEPAADELELEEDDEEDEDEDDDGPEEVTVIDEIEALEASADKDGSEEDDAEDDHGHDHDEDDRGRKDRKRTSPEAPGKTPEEISFAPFDESEEDEEKEEELKLEEEGKEEDAEPSTARLEAVKDTEEEEEMNEDHKGREEEETTVMTPVAKDTFDTIELDKIGRTVDLGRARLDRMLDNMKDEEGPAEPENEGPAHVAGDTTKGSATLPPWANKMIDSSGAALAAASSLASTSAAKTTKPPATDSEEIFPKRRKRSDSTIGLPERNTTPILPFYEDEDEEERIEEGPSEGPFIGDDDEEGEAERGDADEQGKGVHGLFDRLSRGFRRRKTGDGPDTGMDTNEDNDTDLEDGFDEDLDAEAEESTGPLPVHAPVAHAAKAPLTAHPPAPAPLPPIAERRLAGAQDRADERDGEYEEKERLPFSFAAFFKSTMFDLLFVGLFWLVALWLAGRSMDATLFDLLATTPKPIIILYVLLVTIYFFLFKFFLGETLGDRLFKERDE